MDGILLLFWKPLERNDLMGEHFLELEVYWLDLHIIPVIKKQKQKKLFFTSSKKT